MHELFIGKNISFVLQNWRKHAQEWQMQLENFITAITLICSISLLQSIWQKFFPLAVFAFNNIISLNACFFYHYHLKNAKVKFWYLFLFLFWTWTNCHEQIPFDLHYCKPYKFCRQNWQTYSKQNCFVARKIVGSVHLSLSVFCSRYVIFTFECQ